MSPAGLGLMPGTGMVNQAVHPSIVGKLVAINRQLSGHCRILKRAVGGKMAGVCTMLPSAQTIMRRIPAVRVNKSARQPDYLSKSSTIAISRCYIVTGNDVRRNINSIPHNKLPFKPPDGSCLSQCHQPKVSASTWYSRLSIANMPTQQYI